MPLQIAANSFALLMSLPERERADLLEFIGSTTVDERYVKRLVDQATSKAARSQDPIPSTSLN